MPQKPRITALQRVLAVAAGQARERAERLFMLDNECAHIARVAREPIMAQIRLAWWRDGIASVEPRPEHRSDDMDALRALEGFDEIRAHCIAMIDGWEELILFDGTDPGAMLAAFAQGRGGGLFAAMGQGQGNEGAIWALWDVAGHLSDEALAEQATSLGRQRIEDAVNPEKLRPRMLAMMHAVARDDLRRGRGSPNDLTPGLYLRLLRAQLFGR